jgi:hypothetical protein
LSKLFELLQIFIPIIVQAGVHLYVYSVSPLRPELCLEGFPVRSAVEAARTSFTISIEVLAYIGQSSQTYSSEIFGTVDMQVFRRTACAARYA